MDLHPRTPEQLNEAKKELFGALITAGSFGPKVPEKTLSQFHTLTAYHVLTEITRIIPALTEEDVINLVERALVIGTNLPEADQLAARAYLAYAQSLAINDPAVQNMSLRAIYHAPAASREAVEASQLWDQHLKTMGDQEERLKAIDKASLVINGLMRFDLILKPLWS